MSSLRWQLSQSYQKLPEKFSAAGTVAAFPDPQVVLFNRPLADELGLLKAGEVFEPQSTADIFVGNRFPEQAQPLSQAYAGHQFGHFNMLGDGRATLLGEQRTPTGERVDIQLKGNGVTPFSRRGDGKAALAPMLREYLISEAMHALHIPTTRSLAVATTGEQILRDGWQTGAVLTRTAASHLRVATFQFAAAFGEDQDLKILADYTLARHFADKASTSNPYLGLLENVVERQAKLIAQWQLVGFIHGVMNTDNMAISGETIDYGPCAFMDHYDPQTVFSSIDRHGRYRYENQQPIAQWNLARFAETLLPLLAKTPSAAIELATATVSQFEPLFQCHYRQGFAQKLGFAAYQESDQDLVDGLLRLMRIQQADYTNTFVRLTFEMAGENRELAGTQALFASPLFTEWHSQWQTRLAQQADSTEAVVARMQKANPFVIPRNYWVEEVLAQATSGNLQPFHQLFAALQQPFDYQAAVESYQTVPAQAKGYQTFCGT